MDPVLLAALQAVAAFGAIVNDIYRLDAQGEITNIAITWPGDMGMTRYLEDFMAGGERRLARIILEDLINKIGS